MLFNYIIHISSVIEFDPFIGIDTIQTSHSNNAHHYLFSILHLIWLVTMNKSYFWSQYEGTNGRLTNFLSFYILFNDHVAHQSAWLSQFQTLVSASSPHSQEWFCLIHLWFCGISSPLRLLNPTHPLCSSSPPLLFSSKTDITKIKAATATISRVKQIL